MQRKMRSDKVGAQSNLGLRLGKFNVVSSVTVRHTVEISDEEHYLMTWSKGKDISLTHYYFSLFVCLRLNVLVNNCSVILGRFPGFNQYEAIGMKCLAHGHNIAPEVRIEPTHYCLNERLVQRK